MLTPSGLADSFARDNLPPPAAWPDLINLEALGYPERLNCAAELLLRPVREGRGGRPCLVTDDEAWTYADLARRAAQIAGVLSRELGLVPGNRVLLHAPNTPMAVAAWFGCVLAGGIVVATMPLLRGREIATVAEKAAVEFALFDARLGDAVRDAAAQAPRLRHLVAFGPGGDLEGRMAAQPAEFAPVDTAADDICLIAFTSGTTGQPKGTLHFHRDVLAICDGFSRHILQPEADDVFIGSPPLAFTFGLGGLVLFPLRVGASAVLIEKPSPDALLAGIARHRATILFTAPTAYRAMLDRLAQYDTSSLRKGVSAGETLPPATWHAFAERTGIRLIDGIGATEMLHIFISASGDAIRPGATGRPVPGYEARVVDAEGRPLPPGTVGWLAVRGPTGCRYLADDRQGQYVRGGWNVTGDAYLMDADGYFHFQARNDDMIVSAGYNIAGPEVEAALVEHEAVAECAVVASPDAERGHVVKAFVVLRPGFAADEAMVRELQDHVKATIAPYKYPRRIEFVDGLPRTESGKIRRFVLRQREAERARAAPPPQVFETVIPVRFHHVDAAGIVFYPRYFEMINQVVEDWFGSALGLAFAEMHRRDHHGVPTARIDCEFLRPSRLGDALRFALRVERLGGSSCTLRIEASCDGEARLRANAVLVHVDLEPDIAPLPWPAPLRDAMRPYLPSA